MGWSFACDPSFGRKQQIERITRGKFFSEGYTPLAHRVVGNCVWTLLEHQESRFIALTLIKGGGRGWGYGYKGLDETMGPTEVCCPLTLLDRCTEPLNAYSSDWRRKVRAFHAAKKARPEPETGRRVKYGGQEYRLHSPVGPRRGWYVVRCADDAMLRMSARQLASAEFVNQAVQAAA